MSTRQLELTHKEIEIVLNALRLSYGQHLKIVEDNRKILGEDACKQVVENGNKYDALHWEIDNGEKDI